MKIRSTVHRITSRGCQISRRFRPKITPEFLARKWKKLIQRQTGKTTAGCNERAVHHIVSRHGNWVAATRQRLRSKRRMPSHFRSTRCMRRAIGIALSKPSKVTSEISHRAPRTPTTTLIKKFKSIIGYDDQIPCRYCYVVMQDDGSLITAFPVTDRHAHTCHPNLMRQPTLNRTAGTISCLDDSSILEDATHFNLTMDNTLSLGEMDDSDLACLEEQDVTIEISSSSDEACDEIVRPGSVNPPQASQSSSDTRGRRSMKRVSKLPRLGDRAGMPGERGPIGPRGLPGDEVLMDSKARRGSF